MFGILTYCSLLVGHSAGTHRMMIHKTFQRPKWLERILIYIGVVVGMAGPFGILRIHDLRDRAQRQNACHDFFAYRRSYWKDLFWQLTYRFQFDLNSRLSPNWRTIVGIDSLKPHGSFISYLWQCFCIFWAGGHGLYGEYSFAYPSALLVTGRLPISVTIPVPANTA